MNDDGSADPLALRLSAISTIPPSSLMARVARSEERKGVPARNVMATIGAGGFVLVVAAGLAAAVSGLGHRNVPADSTGAVTALSPGSRWCPAQRGAAGGSWCIGVVHFTGDSMLPTIRSGQNLPLADYSFAEPAWGDVVLLKMPSGTAMVGGRLLVKRVIARPGDVVQVAAGVITVNGATLGEPYIEPGWSWETTWNGGNPVTLSAGHYFVLGDNRDHSTDSRAFGFVERAWIRARVVTDSAG